MKSLLLTSLLFLSSAAVSAGVVGGVTSRAPWVVRIGHFDSVHCTGSIIAPQWIITAAHCFYGLNMDPAGWQLSAGGDGSKTALRPLPPIDYVFMHPQYRGDRTVARDVALIKLTFPMVFDETQHAIALRDVSSLEFRNLPVNIAGWGHIDPAGTQATELRSFTTGIFRTQLMAAPTTETQEIIYRRFRAPGILAYINTPDRTCGGDSGTGWTVDRPNEGPHLIAIHSQGDCQSFGIATELSSLLPWIREFIGPQH